jgi:hypothetical protein
MRWLETRAGASPLGDRGSDRDVTAPSDPMVQPEVEGDSLGDCDGLFASGVTGAMTVSQAFKYLTS